MKKTLISMLLAGGSLIAGAGAQTAQEDFQGASNARAASFFTRGWYSGVMKEISRQKEISAQQKAQQEILGAINSQGQVRQEPRYVTRDIRKAVIVPSKLFDKNQNGKYDYPAEVVETGYRFKKGDKIMFVIENDIESKKDWNISILGKNKNVIFNQSGKCAAAKSGEYRYPYSEELKFKPGIYRLEATVSSTDEREHVTAEAYLTIVE